MQLGAFFTFPYGCCKQLIVVQKDKIMTHIHIRKDKDIAIVKLFLNWNKLSANESSFDRKLQLNFMLTCQKLSRKGSI
jgi:hypothetical protein